jgi:hypothetical protein
MDDLGEKLAGILNDPESMERVRKMAESILGESEEKEETPQSPIEDFSNFLGIEDLGNIVSIISRLKESGNDPKAQLLYALKPHLSEPRREKVDTAIKILKLLEILPIIKETGLFKI